jgi:hypothetical protein
MLELAAALQSRPVKTLLPRFRTKTRSRSPRGEFVIRPGWVGHAVLERCDPVLLEVWRWFEAANSRSTSPANAIVVAVFQIAADDLHADRQAVCYAIGIVVDGKPLRIAMPAHPLWSL